MFLRIFRLQSALSFILGTAAVFVATSELRASDRIEPKVLVIATYELGKDRGDAPGELQNWVERAHLDQSITVPGLIHPVLTNGKGLYAMICGTTSRCTVQLMALAMDPRFDLRKTYFMLSGIAGIDPAAGTMGSAVWVRQVVDGDPVFEIDPHDTPKSWPYGIVALGATEPNQALADDSVAAAGISDHGPGEVGKLVYRLNPSLVAWAYQLTKDTPIPDDPKMADLRKQYTTFPKAMQPPTVLEGESLATDRFWSGPTLNQWAEDWVRAYTRGTGVFMASDCEDQGLCQAMLELQSLGKVDYQRLLILRTGSDFAFAPPGMTTEKFLFQDLSQTPGYLPALDSAYRIGSVVTTALLTGWDKYRDHPPSE